MGLREKAAALRGYVVDFRHWSALRRAHQPLVTPHPPASGLVLEIGPGHNPHPRTDVAVEKYIIDNSERGGTYRFDRPLVVADAAALPFADGTFAYVIASHVLEHADDPARFADEMERVARAGFIQLPTSMGEMTFGWPFHHWLSDVRDGVLHMNARDGRHAWAGSFFHDAYTRSPLFRLWFDAHRPQWHHSIEWAKRIPLVVVGTPQREAGAAWEVGPTIAALRAAPSLPLPAPIVAALRCPVDTGRLRSGDNTLVCEACGRRYPYVAGRVPVLLAEAAL